MLAQVPAHLRDARPSLRGRVRVRVRLQELRRGVAGDVAAHLTVAGARDQPWCAPAGAAQVVGQPQVHHRGRRGDRVAGRHRVRAGSGRCHRPGTRTEGFREPCRQRNGSRNVLASEVSRGR